MDVIASIIGAGGQGAQPGKGVPGPMSTQPQAPQQAPIAPIAPGAPGAPGNGFGVAMLPTETKDAFEGTPGSPGGAKPYTRSGFSAGLDSAARIAKSMEHPGQALIERMAGDPDQVGTFAQEHPETLQIVKGLFG